MNLRLNQIYKTKLFFQNKYYYCQVGENGIVPSYKKKEDTETEMPTETRQTYETAPE